MEKIKTDVLIKGDLICKQILTGGVKYTLVKLKN